MSPKTVGITTMVLFQFLMGASPLVIKAVNPGLPPMLFVFLRMGIAAIVLAGLTHMIHTPKLVMLSWKQKIGVALVGVLGSGVASALFVYGVHTIGAGLTNLIAELEIPIAIALAALVFHEKLTAWFYVCAAQILVGFILASGVSMGVTVPLGLVGVLLAAALWGVCTVIGKMLLNGKNIPPITLAKFRGFYGSLAAIVLSLPTISTEYQAILHLSLHDWLGIIYTGAIVSGVGFWMYYHAVKLLPVKVSSLLLIIAPIVTLVLGNFVAKETLSLVQWLGVALLLSGITELVVKKETV